MDKRECEDAISRQAVLDIVENSCLYKAIMKVLQIIDKYKAESEE